jgi:hypothetical protein
MENVGVERSRTRVERTAEGVEVVIPARRRWAKIGLLGTWLGFWAAGAAFVASQLFSGVAPTFEAVVLLAWLFGGGFFLLGFSWMLGGREEAALDAQTLILTRRVGRAARRRAYDRQAVRDLRVSPEPSTPQSGFLRQWGIGGGPLVFDYGSRMVRFGAGLDETEAKSVLAALREAGA